MDIKTKLENARKNINQALIGLEFECPKCGRFYAKEMICPYCVDVICRDAKSHSVIKRQAERIKELEVVLGMADCQLRHIGCFAGCDNGTMSDGTQCQCCDEQEQIRKVLKGGD